MPLIDEGALRFAFATGIQACKFDDTRWYRGRMLSRVKAMDIIARSDQMHWWIEIKDCATYETENMPRLDPNDPPEVEHVRTHVRSQNWERQVKVDRCKPFVVEEIARKIEGTVASLLAAGRAPPEDAEAGEVSAFADACDPRQGWAVVLLLSWNLPDYKRLASRLKTKLASRLLPYRIECWVVNEYETIPGQSWTVTRMP